MLFRFYITLVISSALVFTKPVAAQGYINLEGAQVFSTFKFSSKISEKDQIFTDNQAYTNTAVSSFNLVYQYENSNGFFVLAGVGMRKAGSALVYNNIDYIWKMQYADFKAGIGYQFNKWRIKPYEAVAPYYASLLNAKQYMGVSSYDIKAGKSVKNYDLGMFLVLGFKATISKQISVFTEYNYILGLKNIETTEGQYLYNRGFAVKVGLSLNISSSKKAAEVVPKEPFDLLADKPEPGFIVDTPKEYLPPPANPIVKTTESENKDAALPLASVPIQESAQFENKPETVEEEIISENKITPESVSDNAATTKKISENENQSKKLESVKTNPSDASKVPAAITKKSAKEDSNTDNSDVSSKNKSQKKNLASNRMPTKILFKIQIGSVSKPLGINHPLLKKITGKIEKETGKDGMIRYYTGIFESYDEARSFLSIIKAKGGNEGAFVVAFKNGKQITVYEAKKLIEDNE